MVVKIPASDVFHHPGAELFLRQYWKELDKEQDSTRSVSCSFLYFNFLVAVVISLNTKAHSSKETTEFCFENAVC